MSDSEPKGGRKDDSPPCLKTGEILCRGCPGWPALARALASPDSLWRRYPVRCSAIGLKQTKDDSDEPS